MDLREARKRMVRRLLDSGYISGPAVSKAMEAVERHLFLPGELVEQAYLDTPLHIGEGQTISAPHMVGIMVEALDLRAGQRVLEVGGGSGYHAAVMAELIRPGGRVYSMERIESLASSAKKNLQAAGYADVVETVVGDGTKGLPEHAPYDRISIAAASPGIPQPLKEQLVEGGKLLIPVGGRFYQELMLVIRKGSDYQQRNLGGCVFVPLIGEHGFKD
ncbi:MAG: protein-L-isoaspartate(D-aspartate) O-methyltransferase [Methanomassiliicoccales archaeon]|nr:protein-L-isoaspartate(D-aspartate) O-methyltransferase [Methanomassiliicoccales archaeon]